MSADYDDPAAFHKVYLAEPALELKARAMIAVGDAVWVEPDAIAWHGWLKRS